MSAYRLASPCAYGNCRSVVLVSLFARMDVPAQRCPMSQQVLISIAGELSAEFAAKIALNLAHYESYDIHALFCCTGGELDAGLHLYHTFAKHPANLTLYVASAKSAGAIAMLGARKKKILPHGSVMFHAALTQISGMATINDLRASIEKATSDDCQLRTLIGQHCPNITAAEWEQYSAGCFAPRFQRLTELKLFTEADKVPFPEGGCQHITPDSW